MTIRLYTSISEFHSRSSFYINSLDISKKSNPEKKVINNNIHVLQKDLFEEYFEKIEPSITSLKILITTLDKIFDLKDFDIQVGALLNDGLSRKNFIDQINEKEGKIIVSDYSYLSFEQIINNENDKFLNSLEQNFDSSLNELQKVSAIFRKMKTK